MHIVRTIMWGLLLAALLVFSIANWGPTVSVRIWPGLLLDTKIPMIVIASFLIGFVPLWLYLRGVKWQLGRRIQGMENAARNVAQPVPPVPAPAAREWAEPEAAPPLTHGGTPAA